jgi:2-hydroxychromene-2-carboxylate isomerase
MSIEQVAQLAANRGLLPMRAPAQPQVPTAEAMMAATFAQQSGKVVAYTLAAMRQCWCAGRDLADHSTLFLAGAAAEIHPNALEKAFGLKSLRAQLDRQTEKAAEYGVTQVPAIRVGRTIHFGDSGLSSAAVESLS